MKKFIFGVLVGAAASTVCFVPLLLNERHDKFEYGRLHGGNSARLDIARQLPAALGGDLDPFECTNKFLEVKDAIIWVVERHGVKTLRTY